MPIAPWISVKPSDFVTAAQAGAQLGATIAGRHEQTQAQLAEAGLRASTAGAEAALAQREQDLNRQLREFEMGKRLKLAQDQLDREEREGQQRYELGLGRLGQAQSKEQQDAEQQKLLNEYRGHQLSIAQRRLQLDEQAKTATQHEKSVGRLVVPLTTDKYALNPPKIELPADDPRAAAFLTGDTNVPTAFRTAPKRTAPATFNFNPETEELLPGEDQAEE